MMNSLLLAGAAVMAVLAVAGSVMGPTELPVLAVPGLGAGLALLAAAVFGLTRLRHDVVAPLVVGAVAAIAIDLLVGLPSLTAPIALAAAIGIAWLTRDRLAQVCVVFTAVLLAGTAIRYPAALGYQSTTPVKQHFATDTRPIVVHILLDEMVGLGGIDKALPDGAALHAKMTALFEKHKFRLYERAFSRHYMSEKSIPNALNFNDADDAVGNLSVIRQPRQTTKFDRLRLFEQFKSAGYRLHVFQTAHFDFCANNQATSCSTLASFNPFNPYVDARLDREHMVASLIAKQFQHSALASTYARTLMARSQRPIYASPAAHFEVPAFLNWFDHFTTTVAASRGGDYFFGHFLAPHAPYFLDAACAPRGEWNAGYAMVENKVISAAGFADLRRHLMGLYYRQTSCVLERLSHFLDQIAALPAFANATILIHGDHGSRISSARFAEHVTPRDLIDNYATLFAVRRPGVAPGLDQRKVSLQRLMREIFGGQTDGRSDAEPTVAIEAERGKSIVVRPMPDF